MSRSIASALAFRQQANRIVSRYEIPLELGMALLAAVFIALGLLEDYGSLSSEAQETVAILGDIVSVVFLVEFSFRLYVAPSRKAFLKAHWIDVLALLPTIRFLRFTRLAAVLRLARFARLAVLVRFFASGDRVLAGMKGIATQNNLHFVVAVLFGVTVLSAVAIYSIESGVNKSITSLEDALWWGLVTLTTVGYGDVYPVTIQGRIISAILMILGIVLWGMVTASVTTYFLTSKPEDNGVLKTLGNHVADLHSLSTEELHTLKQLVATAIDDEIAKRARSPAIASPLEEDGDWHRVCNDKSGD